MQRPRTQLTRSTVQLPHYPGTYRVRHPNGYLRNAKMKFSQILSMTFPTSLALLYSSRFIRVVCDGVRRREGWGHTRLPTVSEEMNEGTRSVCLFQLFPLLQLTVSLSRCVDYPSCASPLCMERDTETQRESYIEIYIERERERQTDRQRAAQTNRHYRACERGLRLKDRRILRLLQRSSHSLFLSRPAHKASPLQRHRRE